MADHTSETPGERGTADDRRPTGRSLDPDHAFVVQLRGGPVTNPHQLEGRVEHVVSGEALRFRSAAELIEFLTRGGDAPPRRSPR